MSCCWPGRTLRKTRLSPSRTSLTLTPEAWTDANRLSTMAPWMSGWGVDGPGEDELSGDADDADADSGGVGAIKVGGEGGGS